MSFEQIEFNDEWLKPIEQKTTVVHLKKNHYDIFCARPSKWGNPFVVGKDGDRNEVIEKYREWIITQPQLMKNLHELKGKVLGCWCSPRKCHCDILAELANNLKIRINNEKG